MPGCARSFPRPRCSFFFDSALWWGWQINLNDAFCHGHTIENNLLFNWVRETQDHGPINTWNRAAYMHVGKDGEPTNVPEWTHISHVRGTS